MKAEIIRDRTSNLVDRFLENRTFQRFCWAVIWISTIYFGSVFAWSLATR